jgi:hypothetical protein
MGLGQLGMNNYSINNYCSGPYHVSLKRLNVL